jgi:hypothetical protein
MPRYNKNKQWRKGNKQKGNNLHFYIGLGILLFFIFLTARY